MSFFSGEMLSIECIDQEIFHIQSNLCQSRIHVTLIKSGSQNYKLMFVQILGQVEMTELNSC